MAYGWLDRPAKARVSHRIGGDTPATVFRVGRYDVTVPGEDRDDVTYKDANRSTYGDPRNTLPNMDITDGVINIPVTDLVDEVLARVSPTEIAEALWSNQEVRTAFIERLGERWFDDFTDSDRRNALATLKENIHSKALDSLASAMMKLEYALAKRSFFYHEVHRVNDSLADTEKQLRWSTGDEKITLPRLKHEDHDPDFKIGGKVWNEARDDWRELVQQRFPTPTKEP